MTQRMSKGLLRRWKQIRMLVLDVDGVLTDGGMYYGAGGEVLKKFNTKDGMGIARLRRIGIPVAFITGETTPIVRRRAVKLKVEEVFEGVEEKGVVLRGLLARHGLKPSEVAYVGDDLNDLPALEIAGLAIAVADAVPEVRRAAHFVTTLRGGEGAVREVADLLLQHLE